MLWSAPAAKSGSNWLDRLRSIKGIPTGDDLDLDSFLTLHSSSPDPPLFPPKRVRNRTRGADLSTPDAADSQPITSVLAELFNMGGSLSQRSNLSGKKCPRKQTNPKSFVASSLSNCVTNDCARKDEENVPCTNSFSNNDVLEMEQGNTASWDVEEEEEEEKEKENGGNELKGFSKSEVTVIDTSRPEWKTEKFVFRKNSVWKVREKKGKSKFFGKKKRKGSFGTSDKEVKLLDQSQFGSSVETNTQELITPSAHELNSEKEIKDVGVEDTPGQAQAQDQDHPKPPPRKRFQCSRSPRTSRKQNKSVIIIKTIPT